MKILADHLLSHIDPMFSTHGQLSTFNERQPSRDQIKEAELLIVRSTTQVNSQLLDNTSVKMVASATIGIDHVDLNYLHQNNIKFAYAPGCNAIAVAEYVLASICHLYSSDSLSKVQHKQVAIIGCGHVGSIVKQYLELLGLNVWVNDPPLQQQIEAGQKTDPGYHFVDLQQALSADIICMHTPLSDKEPHPTYHLLHCDNINAIKPGSLLINAGRGATIDNKALLKRLKFKNDLSVVLDVWESEPLINTELIPFIDLASQHIAGHSWQGKFMGSQMLYEQACEFFGWTAKPLSIERNLTHYSSQERDFWPLLCDLMANIVAIKTIDKQFRSSLLDDHGSFDSLRKKYSVRPQANEYMLDCLDTHAVILSQLGFKVRA